jgi:hypothetical protein
MKKHFVTFFSPGTFVAETTTKEIDLWDVERAMEMSGEVLERYDALPYGFQFTTRERGDSDFDSKEVARSGMYYLGGEVLTIDDLKKQNDPSNRILISNMEINGWDRVVVNKNSWSWTQPLKDDDVVLK